ncbi:MAG: hypothetical protein PHI12_06570 [Dehalococcoidales bacterium]|nr:hypothetical protein [Dehalococcoidales bacterium]
MNKLNLGPGIYEPICGWPWVDQHWNDPYPEPHFEFITPTCRQSMTIKNPGVVKEVARIMKGG